MMGISTAGLRLRGAIVLSIPVCCMAVFLLAAAVPVSRAAEQQQNGAGDAGTATAALPPGIQCEGEYGAHLQGVATNHKDALFWSFTLTLVKTDLTGKVQATAKTVYHLGDLTCADGRVYAAACTSWDKPSNNSKVYVYDANDLKLLDKKPVPEATYGAGGIEYYDGRFYIVGGADPKAEENFIYVYDKDFKYVATHTIPSGHTELGVQTISRHGGFFWLGCYGNILLKLDDSLNIAGRYAFDSGYGMKLWQGNDVLVGQSLSRDEGNSKRWRGAVRLAHVDEGQGLVFNGDAKQ